MITYMYTMHLFILFADILMKWTVPSEKVPGIACFKVLNIFLNTITIDPNEYQFMCVDMCQE